MSGSGSIRQFGTAHHSRVTMGAWDDDNTPDTSQIGQPHPVHQGVTSVTPYSASTSSTLGRMRAWRLNRSGNDIPSGIFKGGEGSIIDFNKTDQ
jgi:hypothetical protein